MGPMASYDLQLWLILQDMSQFWDLYGARASTFVANAGVQQVFGVNDYETAQWLSKSMGRETIGYQTQSHKPGDAPTTATSITGRDFLTSDEIMRMAPVIAQKLGYYVDPEFAGLVAATSAA